MKIVNNKLPLYYRTRVHVGSKNLVFIGFIAGGTEEEVEAGECLCESRSGTEERHHLEELELGWVLIGTKGPSKPLIGGIA